jgi:hypothetical protein
MIIIKKTQHLYIGTLLILLAGCLPKPPAYPFTGKTVSQIETEAQLWSDNLEAYIKQWYKGEKPAELPLNLLPVGLDTATLRDFKLIKYEDIKAEEQWGIREAHEIDFKSLRASFPDPHCTYIVLPALCAPFKSKLVIEGDFPYSRFFDIQVSPPFESAEYRYSKWVGKGEVGIVDVDIKPNDGSINPFIIGNDRQAEKRAYKVEFELAIGNPTKINKGAHQPPYYRGEGNTRYASALQFQGPWGIDKKHGHGRGLYDLGDIWIRYYAIDKSKDVHGGVKLPKAYYQLASGEKFYISCDFKKFLAIANATMPNRKIGNGHSAKYNGPTVGWNKAYGIFLSISSGLGKALDKTGPKDKEYIRKLDLGVSGRGEDQPAPASYEPHATGCNYINYLQRGFSIKKGYVIILTGKLPTFPDTRNGAKEMTKAQCRYFSFTTYDSDFPFAKLPGLEQTSIMDDEIKLDSERKYMIVYSQEKDKPINATAENNVTWVNYGLTCTQAITLRWLSVGPEWAFDKTPNEINLPWSKALWSGKHYDPTLIELNNHSGFLGWYLPQVHYMSKKEFEKLGTNLKADNMPVWK